MARVDGFHRGLRARRAYEHDTWHTWEVLYVLKQRVFDTQGTFSQGIGKDVQEVGFAHTTDEADNDRGGKGRTYKPFCGAKHPAHARCEEVENAFRRIALQAF